MELEPKTCDNAEYLFKDELDRMVSAGSKVRVYAKSFSMYSYDAIQEILDRADRFEFLYRDNPFEEVEVPETRSFEIPKRVKEKYLYGACYEIRLKDGLSKKAVGKQCANWIRSSADFKALSEDQEIPGNFLLLETDDGGEKPHVVGWDLPNGYFDTSVLGLKTQKQPKPVFKLSDEKVDYFAKEFGRHWGSLDTIDVTRNVLGDIDKVYKENSPEFIYAKSLYEVFSHSYTSDDAAMEANVGVGYTNTKIWKSLYDFQYDAALSIIKRLNKYSGCILADSVGLGKTYTALAVIKYFNMRNFRVLVICPKKLSANWLTFKNNQRNNEFADDKITYDLICHTDLSRKYGQTVDGLDLKQLNLSNYDLVVIDEAHAFRNGGVNRSSDEEDSLVEDGDQHRNRYEKLLHEIIDEGADTKVLMLTATPVNNRLWDLRNQLHLLSGLRNSATSNPLGLSTDFDAVFRNAQKVISEWEKEGYSDADIVDLCNRLPQDFFAILDQLTVARSRKQIQQHYDANAIGAFPNRLPVITRTPGLVEGEGEVTYSHIYTMLSELSLGIYQPSNYIFESAKTKYDDEEGQMVKGRELGIQNLMRVNLLKRLESSVHAFRLTTTKILGNMQQTVEKLESLTPAQTRTMTVESLRYYVSESDILNGDFDDEDYAPGELTEDRSAVFLADIDLFSWVKSIEQDIEILEALLEEIEYIESDNDLKLQQLGEDIREKMRHPINAENKKVLIFTTFADTADYLYEYISKTICPELGVNAAVVTGSTNKNTVNDVANKLEDILVCFSPESKKRQLTYPEYNGHDIDILIATDCISEGQNLQDADYVINYDIHWNPIRIIQRFGRVDRIGSKNGVIQLVNYWPDIELEAYIGLRERVQNRMKITVMTATGDDNYLDSDDTGLDYRAEQLRRMRHQVLDLEDSSGTISLAELGLSEFENSMRNLTLKYSEVADAPDGIGAVARTIGDQDVRGVIYLLKNNSKAVGQVSSNRLYPYYLVYIGNDGVLVADHHQPRAVLQAMHRYSFSKDQPIPELYEPFNKETKNGKDMSALSKLLTSAIEQIIDSKQEDDVDSLLLGETTTFLDVPLEGLDDFSLISFLVVR